MKPRREIKVGMCVRFEHMRDANTIIGTVIKLEGKAFKINTGKFNVWATRRQIISVFVKKAKPEHEYIFCNVYGDGSLGTAKWDISHCPKFGARTCTLKCLVVSREKV